MEQRLAAVMAADVVDYSRMMGADARGTLATLQRLRGELFAPAVAGHRGRVVKSMGDGWIVTFASASDAVTCAMRLQDRMVLEPEIRIRIGLHIGDVAVVDEDVFGEGVNVAARLEALTEPGGISLSDAVHAMLDGTLRPAFDDAGDRVLKNIDRPVRVWTRGGLTGGAALADRDGLEGFPRLCIAPVGSSSDTRDVRELADALTHDLATYLSGSRWLRARVTLDATPGSYVVSATLRASGGKLRLQTQLVAPDGGSLWSGKHDGTLDDIFDWQDETASAIATQVVGRVLDHVTAGIASKPEDKLSWQELTILAMQASKSDRDSLARGLSLIARATDQSPPSSYPYEFALAAWAATRTIGFRDLSQAYAGLTRDWMDRARELAGPATTSRAIIAFFEYVSAGDAARAYQDIDAFLRDMPFDTEALVFAGYLYLYLGEPERALDCFARFDLFSAHHVFAATVRNGTGAALTMLGRYDDALPELDAAIRMSPGFPAPYRWKAAALALSGRVPAARETLAMHDDLQPGITISTIRAAANRTDSPGTRRFEEGLRLAGMPP